MNVTIRATGVKSTDIFLLRPVSGNDIIPVKVSYDASSYTMTIPSACPAAVYTLVAERNNFSEQTLGSITVNSTFNLPDFILSDSVFITGSSHDVIISASTGGFALGDKVRIVDSNANIILDQTITFANSSNPTSFSLTVPATLLGKGALYIERGEVVKVFGFVETIAALAIGDYWKGGVVIWLNASNPAHGITMQLFHGWATARNVGDAHLRRTVYGSAGNSNGTGTTDLKQIGMGDVCTKMLLNYEIGKGLDPAAIDMGGYTLPTAAYMCSSISIVGKDGVIYDDWFLPSIGTIQYVWSNVALLNEAFDREGGESFAGTGYVYQYGSETGGDGYDKNDGGGNYVSANERDDYILNCYYLSFGENGALNNYSKDTNPWYYVRAVRKF
jgi:hypothetical protein